MKTFTVARCMGVLVALCSLSHLLPGEEWAAWRGPRHDGSTAITPQLPWPDSGPLVRWRAEVGRSGGGMGVAAGRVLTHGFSYTEVGNKAPKYHAALDQHLICLDLATGRELWRQTTATHGGWSGGFGIGAGAASTPVIDRDSERVYSLDRLGVLRCHALSDGVLLWQRDLLNDEALPRNHTGIESSPAVHGDLVLVNVCDPVGMALDKRTGETRWVSRPPQAGLPGDGWHVGQGGASHATPVPFPAAGPDAMLLHNGRGLALFDATSGKVAWQFAFGVRHSHGIPSPLVRGDSIFLHSCYEKGGVLLRADGRAVEQQQKVAGKLGFACFVWREGFVYGPGRCIDMASGTHRYEVAMGEGGGIVLAGDTLLTVSEAGQLYAVATDPDRHAVISQATIFSAERVKVYAPPSIADRAVLVRSIDGEVVCIELAP